MEWGGEDLQAWIALQEQEIDSKTESKAWTGESLQRYLTANDWKVDPLNIVLNKLDALTIGDVRDLLSMSKLKRDARTPKPVQLKQRCVLCWSPSSALCKRCSLWALCSTCSTRLEGNCCQCLYEDQADAANERVKARIPFEEASMSPS